MTMATIDVIEYELKASGRLIPRLHFKGTPIVKGKPCGYVTGYNVEYIMTNWLGVGAIVFLDRDKANRAKITWNNFPMFPDSPQYCNCGPLFTRVGKDFICNNEGCTFKGNAVWFMKERINWLRNSDEFSVPWKEFQQHASAGPLRTLI